MPVRVGFRRVRRGVRRVVRRSTRCLLAGLLCAAAIVLGQASVAHSSRAGKLAELSAAAHHEKPKDPPASPVILQARTVSGGGVISYGQYVSIQVNVDGDGNNIVGDAANEPTIAVDPLDSSRIVLGWRQFDSITSNFRQAGVAYSADAGMTWTAGVVDPGAFRTDPVLSMLPSGRFLYSSLTCLDYPGCSQIRVHMFGSDDGGQTWPLMADAYGGDKQWMTVDERAAGDGAGFVYQYWTASLSCCPGNFTRSTDGGATFEGPYSLPNTFAKWGTLDVAQDGTLYVVGADQTIPGHTFMRSSDAKLFWEVPDFELVQNVDLGGYSVGLAGIDSPNPTGLMGQVWVAAGRQLNDAVYMLASVRPDGDDPLDVHFAVSSDRGQTWSAPVAINDNAGDGTWQWFGTMSVAPNGRIDVLWADTRESPDSPQLSQLYFARSNNGGVSWTPNVPVTPQFNTHLGFPQESKLGDYFHGVSVEDGTHVAYAATFSGGQDIYYLWIPAEDEPVFTEGVGPEPTAMAKNRFISFLIPPPSGNTGVSALRVRLSSLHHPPAPANAPNFSAFEGEYRYVNVYRNAADQPIYECLDSPGHGTYYFCAKLSCVPEYRDWNAELGGEVLHVTGTEIVPSSTYHVAVVPAACTGNEEKCELASLDLTVPTARWGDVVPDTLNAIDIARQVDKVKDAAGAIAEVRGLLRPDLPAPLSSQVNAVDLGYTVDAVKGLPYPHSGPAACP